MVSNLPKRVDVLNRLATARLSRRRFVLVSAALSTSGLLAACGGDDDDPTATSAPAATSTTAQGAEPTATAESAEPTTAPGGATAAPSTPTEAAPAATEAQATPTEAAEATPTEAETSDIPRGGTLIYARNLDTRTLDPHFSTQLSERYTLYLIFNTLVGYDTDFSIIPDLAASWEIGDDGTTVTFFLHEGVTFHDGTPCDAEAVKWNIDRVLDPDVTSPMRSQLVDAVESVEVIDATTVQFNLFMAWRPLLASLGERPGFIISPTAAQELGEDFGLNPVGSGPFKFVEWVPDSRIVLERNENYWDTGKPYLDRIELLHVPDGQVQLTMIRTGEAHLIDAVPPGLLATLRGVDDVVIEELESARFTGSQCDLTKPPFDNADLRAAISFATDREEIRQVTAAGTGRVATHPLGGGWAYDESLNDQFQRYDPDLARQHLEASGYNGETLTLTVSNTQASQELGQLLQAQYARIGINVELEVVNAADAFTMVREDQTNWTTTNWAPRADPDGLLRILWHSQGFQNTTEFSNPEVDRLLDEAATMYDTAQARELYRQAEEIIASTHDYVFHTWPSVFAVRRANVGNFQFHPDLIIRMREFYLDE